MYDQPSRFSAKLALPNFIFFLRFWDQNLLIWNVCEFVNENNSRRTCMSERKLTQFPPGPTLGRRQLTIGNSHPVFFFFFVTFIPEVFLQEGQKPWGFGVLVRP